MRSPVVVVMLCLILALPVTAGEFVPLFNGKDLTGWKGVLRAPKDKPDFKPDPKDTWSVKDGILICKGKPNGYLATEKEYSDYSLRLKWRFPKDEKAPNSGILVHITGPDKIWPHSIEMQMKAGFAGDYWRNANSDGKMPALEIEASRKDPANKEGRHFFRLNKEETIEKPLGEWNECELVCKGGAIRITINGKLANEATGGELKSGRIGLQSEGSEVHFKDILILGK